MFHTLLSQATTLLTGMVCVGALVVGRWPERLTAVCYGLNWIGSAVGQERWPGHHAQPVIMALDIGFLAVLLVLTVVCRRTWVLWMAACSLLVVLTHVLGMVDLRFHQWTYLTAYYIWSLGGLIAFTAGVIIEGRKPVGRLIYFV